MHHIKLNERNHTIKSSYIGPFNEPLYQIIHNIKKYNITNLTHNFYLCTNELGRNSASLYL